MWRPEGWDKYKLVKHCPYANGEDCKRLLEHFEAGADAMLEALKKKGAMMTPKQMKLIVPDRKYPYGYLVFIPDEEA